MNSNLTKQARDTVVMIMAGLDPDRIKQQIDDPIAMALREYDYVPTCPIAHNDFHRMIAGLLELIYGKAAAVLGMPGDPLAEAIWLLENTYQSAVYGSGYIAALLDANDPAEGGIQTVLRGLAESIKAIKRQEYTGAVFARYLYGCSWRLRCEIARVLLEDHGLFMPERLRSCPPANLADEIPSLISMLISGDSLVAQMVLSGVI